MQGTGQGQYLSGRLVGADFLLNLVPPTQGADHRQKEDGVSQGSDHQQPKRVAPMKMMSFMTQDRY
jgi:hypothetical protein